MRQVKKILLYLKKVYAIDLRALAVMRIGLALVIMADLFIRGSDLSAFYTAKGIWPAELMHLGWKSGYWSFHQINESLIFQYFLFGIHFLFAVFLLLGIQPRLISILLFLFTVSLHNRNIYILQAGDDLLRLTLLWGIFLPWGERYSLRKERSVRSNPAFFASTGYLLLIASVYFFSALLKSSPEWHSQGSAIYYALSLEQLRLPAGNFIYYHPSVLKLMTHAVYFTELLIPFLILLPLRSIYPRLIAFILIVILHLSIGITLYVGLFFIIGIITAIGLIPSGIFDQIENRFSVHRSTVLKAKKKLSAPFINGLCALLAFLSVVINLSSLPDFSYKLRDELLTVLHVIRLDQYWGMFSPSVLKADGWYVYHGMDSIGRQWDLRLNQDYVDYKKPEHIVSHYKNDRWRKLAENMQDDRFTFLRPQFCKYIVTEWNREHPEKKIKVLNLYFMEKKNLPGYVQQAPAKKLFCVCHED